MLFFMLLVTVLGDSPLGGERNGWGSILDFRISDNAVQPKTAFPSKRFTNDRSLKIKQQPCNKTAELHNV